MHARSMQKRTGGIIPLTLLAHTYCSTGENLA